MEQAGGKLDAVIATNDAMAMGAIDCARSTYDLAIPGQISIVGFDDLPMASRVWPNLTTVRLPIRDKGRMAAEKLLAPMRNVAAIENCARGIDAMAREEAAYWLGMAMHRKNPRRVLAALRLLLSAS